jgi:SAM-dependent methyltransferase
MSGGDSIGDAIYALPYIVTRLDDCFFYHSIEIPGYGLVEGPWDLRAGIGDYLGRVDLCGRRVLELGTASGFVCFHMERQGANVVAYDLSPDRAHLQDIVVFAGDDPRIMSAEYSSLIHLINNGWWLGHRAFRSSARLVHGSVYDVPSAIGTVDVAVFGSILLHVRDPFLALASPLRMVRETVIVTEPYPRYETLPPVASWMWGTLSQLGANVSPMSGWRKQLLRLVHKICGDPLWKREVALRQFEEHLLRYGERKEAIMTFIPDYRRRAPKDAWWHLSPAVIREFLGVLGFEDSRESFHTQLHEGRATPMFTVVANRTRASI